MATKSTDQVTIIDVTDGYSVMLSSEAYVFSGDVDGIQSGQTCSTSITAYCGSEQCSNVTISRIDNPAGILSEITDNDTSNPKITFTTNKKITASCESKIAVIIDGIIIVKVFTFAVAVKGVQGIQGLQGEKGEQGIAGPPGETGKTSYFHIKYSSKENPTLPEEIGDIPSTYIGTYVDFTEKDSTDPTKYTWSRFVGAQGPKGDQGIQGVNGENGQTTYLHIAYANSPDGTKDFSTTDQNGREYMGVYTDFSIDDSTDSQKYTWSKIRGETGPQGIRGEQGIPGPPGETGLPGKTSYFHIKYSNIEHPQTSYDMSELPSTYIGTYVDFTEKDSDDPSKYTWARFEGIQGEKGTQGIPGENGENGKTSYLHIAYADSADGSKGFTTIISEGKLYIGQYTDFSIDDSNDYKKYNWTKIKGEQGNQGPQGEAGEDALTVAITSSNGSIFKNNTGATVLTAHVYKGAIEQPVDDSGNCPGLGVIRWYKGDSKTPESNGGKSLIVTANDVMNSVVYTAQLE